MTNATDLARTLYTQDAAHGTPEPDGRKAYAGWLAASCEAGDVILADALFNVRPRDFAEAWESIITEA